MRFARTSCLIACAVSALATTVTPRTLQSAAKKQAAAYVADAVPWEHESSDLKPDPRFHFGSFKNGLRYAWCDNRQPAKQLMLRLHVDVGSLAERGEEVGLAHFLEHMAFNGSKSFKPGTLIPTFQTQGIRFGSDVNAHTGFDETVYELDLPDADSARLEKSLLWFRDVIDGLKLDAKEIEAEKGVVDAEEESRDGQGMDSLRRRLTELLDGSRFPRRLPIGEKSVRAKFDPKLVKGFWDRWYRPERCTFVLVGDLNGLDPTPLLEKAFAEAKGRGKAEELPDAGLEALTFAHTRFSERNGGGLTFYVGAGHAMDDVADTTATRAALLEQTLACSVLEERLNTMVPRPFILADVACGGAFHLGDEVLVDDTLEGISVRLQSDLDHWKEALCCAEREVRRMLEREITDVEWQAAQARFVEAWTPTEPDQQKSTSQLIAELLDATVHREVPMERSAARELWKKLATGADRQRGQASFRAEWTRGKLLLVSIGALDLGDSAKELFDDAWKESTATRLDVKPMVRNDLSALAPKKEPKKPATVPTAGQPAATDAAATAAAAAATFPYALKDPEPQFVPLESTPFLALQAQRLVLNNGVKAFVKQQDGASGRFRVEARVGNGLLGIDAAQCYVAKLAALVAPEAALAKQKRAELDAALAAAGGGIGFEVRGDACVVSGRSTGSGGESGLRRVLEALVGFLSDRADPGPAFDELKKNLGAHIVDTDRPTFGSARLAFDRAVADGDRRRLPLEAATASKVTKDEVAKFLAEQLAGPVEVVIVGELPVERMARQFVATLGQLAPRAAALATVDSRRDAPPFKSGLLDSRGAIDIDGKVVILHIAYPGTDARDSLAERRVELAGDVVGERMRAEIREKLGTTYSPRGDAWGDPTFRGRGEFTIDLQVDPSKLAVTKEACFAALEKLAKAGTDKAEFDRLRAARAGSLGATARHPDFWLEGLQRAWRTPALLDQLADLAHWYDGVALAEVNALLKQSLTRSKASVLEIASR